MSDSSYERARAVADAILYEGYLLYPYRKSAAKNRLRWQFGVLSPRDWAEHNLPADLGVAGSAESWFARTECIAECPPGTTLTARLRFLQAQRRGVERYAEGTGFEPVEELEVDDHLVLSFDEAIPHERDVVADVAALIEDPSECEIDVADTTEVELLRDRTGRVRGRIRRRCRAARIRVTLTASRAGMVVPLVRISVVVENVTTGIPPGASRSVALSRSLLAAHSFLGLSDGGFVSLLDPPAWAAEAVAECSNVHTFPVLAGDDDRDDLVLSSPVILYDHPRIAPESPGDLFDAGEIDEILSLRTLTLTDEEKREARATDARAAEIVDRVDGAGADVFARLHGTFRPDLVGATGEGAVYPEAEPRSSSEPAWWQPGGDDAISPETDEVVVAGVPVRKGSRVRLVPRKHGTDVHDIFLADRYARVEAVLTDVDGSRFVAVSVEDDPAADLQRELGRFFHFSPDEVLPADREM
jgi:hypothetical protein